MIRKSRTSRGYRGLLATAAVAAVAGSAFAVAEPSNGSSPREAATGELTHGQLFASLERRGRARAHLSARVADVAVSRAARSLALFSRPRATEDAMPLSQAEILPEPVEAEQSRLAFSAAGNSVYLVPSAEGICISDTSHSLDACVPTAMVSEGGAAESTECGVGLPNDETVEIAGVIPDQARDAVVILSDGDRRPLTVRNGVFLEDFSRHGPLPTEIEVLMPAGPHFFSSTVPSDAGSEHCEAR
jgi:hypothetical protein